VLERHLWMREADVMEAACAAGQVRRVPLPSVQTGRRPRRSPVQTGRRPTSLLLRRARAASKTLRAHTAARSAPSGARAWAPWAGGVGPAAVQSALPARARHRDPKPARVLGAGL